MSVDRFNTEHAICHSQQLVNIVIVEPTLINEVQYCYCFLQYYIRPIMRKKLWFMHMLMVGLI